MKKKLSKEELKLISREAVVAEINDDASDKKLPGFSTPQPSRDNSQDREAKNKSVTSTGERLMEKIMTGGA